MSKIVAASCVGLALLSSVGAGSATAAIFSVNSTGDDGDLTPGDGSCFTGTLILVGPFQFIQECTLRAAAEESNALAGPDAVAFDSIPLNNGSFAVIVLGTSLPSLIDTIDIDGTTAPGYDVGDISANPVGRRRPRFSLWASWAVRIRF